MFKPKKAKEEVLEVEGEQEQEEDKQIQLSHKEIVDIIQGNLKRANEFLQLLKSV